MAGTQRAARLLIIATALLLGASESSSQEIQNGLSYRDVPADRYFRFNYENDVFFGTDRYFTQGVHFELVNRAFSRSLIRRLFPALQDDVRRCGIGLESAGYSPTSITADSILRGDHPFAGLAYAKLISISIDTLHRRRLTGTLSLGWMGPGAGGYEIQSAIHRAVGSPEPLGWKYQLNDQPVLNYELSFEQQIGLTPRWLRLSAWGMLRAGTLSNRAAIGAVITARPLAERTDLRIYVHPAIAIPVYEAVLQGGPFTVDNPYRIRSEDVRRVVGSTVAGLNIPVGKTRLSAYVRWQTATFRGGSDHALGGVMFATGF